MSFAQTVKKLEEEIKGNNRKEDIESYEKELSKSVEELSKNEDFYNLPLINIFSVISKVNFNEIDENDKILKIIQNIIKNIIKKHFQEKETILILQNLNVKTISFSYDEIFSLLELIKNCPILVKFCHLHNDIDKEVDLDFDYELEQKDKEIEKLKQEINDNFDFVFHPTSEKPKDYEPDIFKACKEGKMPSVYWLIEKEKEDQNKKVEEEHRLLNIYKNDTPIHIASQNGHLLIVQYLIEKQNVDKDIKGHSNRTPLHYASQGGHLPIVEYLLSKGADIGATDKEGKTALHYACENGHVSTADYLISNGSNIEAKTKDDWTPLHFAAKSGSANLVNYMLSKGANKNVINKYGNAPYDLTDNYAIKNTLQ